jgi:TPR repeat protein
MNISTATASLLTGKATKTLYRWVDDGALSAKQESGEWGGSKIGGRLLFSLPDLSPYLEIPITPELEAELEKVERGLADGYNEIGLLFAEATRYDIAIKWFEMAAKKGHIDAMDWLSTCYLEGLGTKVDLPRALEWLGRAAAAGHPVARAKIEAIDQ